MPKGEPSKNTIRIERYQKKAGYIAKTYKLKKNTVEEFAEACKKANISQAAQITKMMEAFIKEVEDGEE